MAKKKIVRIKKRIRFCSLDYYRYIVTGVSADIQGITKYQCSNDMIKVQYDDGKRKVYFVNEGEKQLKEIVSIINKYLGGEKDVAQ